MNKQHWTYKKLGEVAEYAKTRINSRDISIENYIGVDNLLQNCQGRSFAAKVPNELGLTEYWEGDVLIGNIRPYLRKIWLADSRGGCNGDVLAIRRKHEYTSLIDTSFLYKCLSTNYFFDFAMQYAKGEKMPSGDKKEILKYLIPIPPIDEQERIVAELDLLSGVIEKKKEQLKAYDQLAQSIFYTMFGDPIDNPKGWETKKLGEIASFKNGLNYHPKEDGISIKCIGVGDFQDRNELRDFENIRNVTIDEMVDESYYLKDGDIIIVRSNGSKELVGRNMIVYPNLKNVTYSGFCIRCRLSSSSIQPTILSRILSDRSTMTVLRQEGRGCNISNINQKILSSLQIIFPPLSLQHEFAEKVEAIERQKALVQQSIEETQTMFDFTMDKYFG